METGAWLGPYEIIEPLGAGGMGEVYRARDSRLERDVAIKVLPAGFTADKERLARFEREAKLLAQLTHPNIAGIYGIEDADAVRFIIMECVEGATLAERIKAEGRIETDEAIQIGRQIAEALEAAHDAGIIHRDLKPANIKITPEGQVKVLDFGLAKAFATDSSTAEISPDLSHSPTMAAVTRTGVILGTAAYMSPEQARGKTLDKRTDLWAFGCVLYEMLTGRRAFAGETVSDILAAILRAEPDLEALPPSIPPGTVRLIEHCLRKDPRLRLRDAGDACLELEETDATTTQVSAWRAQRRSVRDRLGWPVAALMAALAAALGWQLWPPPTAGESPAYLDLHEPGIRLASNVEGVQVAVSPDGRSVAIAGQDEDGRGIWIRNLAEPRARRLQGAEGSDLAWSPDGQQIAFVDGNGLRLHDLRTSANSVCYRGEGSVNSPRWTADGRLVFSVNLGREFRILEVLSSGQNATLLSVVRSSRAAPGLRSYPLGKGRFLVSRWNPAHGHVDTTVFHADGQADEPLLHLDAAPEWAPPDLLLFARDGALWAQRFDVENARLRGVPVALLAEIDTAASVTPWLSIGGDTLSYRTGLGYESPTVLEWVDRGGRLVDRAGEPANYFDPRIAPDGRTIVFDLSNEGDAGDIWLGAGDGPGVRLTSSLADETRPVWSPDGSRVVLETTREGQTGRLYVKNVSDPAGELRVLGADPAVDEPTDWARNTIVGNDGATTTIWIVDAATGESRPFRETNFADYGGALAPDASHIAYVSNETGRDEIWVDTFPSPGTPRRVSPQGGTTPVWRRDGNEIVYLDPDGFITSVAVTSMSPLTLGEPEPLFQVSLRVHDIRQFDVSPDGQRFLLNRVIENPDLPIRLLLGWREELARRAGPDW